MIRRQMLKCQVQIIQIAKDGSAYMLCAMISKVKQFSTMRVLHPAI